MFFSGVRFTDFILVNIDFPIPSDRHYPNYRRVIGFIRNFGVLHSMYMQAVNRINYFGAS